MTLPYKWDGQENAIDRARRAWRGLLGSAFPGVGQIARGDFTGLLSDLGAKAREGLARKPFDASEDAAVRDMNRAMDFISPAGLLGGMTKFEKAHKIAQRNAALPVEQGGLGLPKNNTAADRAKAMGFDADVYHGTNADIAKFDPKKSAMGGITWVAEAPKFTEDFIRQSISGGNILPLKARLGKTAGWDEYDKLGIGELRGRGFNSAWLPEDGGGSAGFVLNPNQLRSRFAAFDPKRKHEADLLAGYFGFVPSQE